MKIYLVGGAVRDRLLGYPIKERDWVVVGATPQQMLDLGYRPVGKDFPVFLHPVTHEEYALARTERKTAPGYKGFHFHAAPDVTLEQDLQRRDLTINAMAQTPEGAIIDPYGGQSDLAARLLRHVSAAFSEDPVRILRIARFSARFGDFSIHPTTSQLMTKMVENREINALVAERVWQEWERALQEPFAERFFYTLFACGALPVLLPELTHPTAGLAALQRAVQRHLPNPVRLAVLFYPLDAKAIAAIVQRYKLPKDYHDLALLIWGNYPNYVKVQDLEANLRLALLERLDAFRRPERFNWFLAACETIANEPMAAGKSQLLQQTYLAAKSVNVSDLAAQKMSGEQIRKVLRERQITAIVQQTL